MKNIVKGLSVEKWVMINHPKIPQMPKLSTQAQKGFNTFFSKYVLSIKRFDLEKSDQRKIYIVMNSKLNFITQ